MLVFCALCMIHVDYSDAYIGCNLLSSLKKNILTLFDSFGSWFTQTHCSIAQFVNSKWPLLKTQLPSLRKFGVVYALNYTDW